MNNKKPGIKPGKKVKMPTGQEKEFGSFELVFASFLSYIRNLDVYLPFILTGFFFPPVIVRLAQELDRDRHSETIDMAGVIKNLFGSFLHFLWVQICLVFLIMPAALFISASFALIA